METEDTDNLIPGDDPVGRARAVSCRRVLTVLCIMSVVAGAVVTPLMLKSVYVSVGVHERVWIKLHMGECLLCGRVCVSVCVCKSVCIDVCVCESVCKVWTTCV